VQLTSHNESLHEKIKTLRETGMADIPAVLVSENLTERVSAENAAALAETITKLSADAQIEQALRKSRVGTPKEQAAELEAELEAIRETLGKQDTLVSGAELNNRVFPPTAYAVQDIIPVGLTVFAGAPKMGKTWLSLLLASCVSYGTPVLGKKTMNGRVLYYCLEDGLRGCQERLKKLNFNTVPAGIYFRETLKNNMTIMADIKTTDAKLVFLDTFVAYANVEDVNSYGETTRKTRELKRIADTFGISVVLIHHSRKDKDKDDWVGSLMGSQGIAGAADAIVYLNRKRFEKNGYVYVTGRSVKDDMLSVRLNGVQWEVENAGGKDSK
jgi:predicted ATP-dependent serine protease